MRSETIGSETLMSYSDHRGQHRMMMIWKASQCHSIYIWSHVWLLHFLFLYVQSIDSQLKPLPTTTPSLLKWCQAITSNCLKHQMLRSLLSYSWRVVMGTTQPLVRQRYYIPSRHCIYNCRIQQRLEDDKSMLVSLLLLCFLLYATII